MASGSVSPRGLGSRGYWKYDEMIVLSATSPDRQDGWFGQPERLILISGILLAVLFHLFPQLDLWPTRQVYDHERGFYAAQWPWVRLLYWTFARAGALVLFTLVGALLLYVVAGDFLPRARPPQSSLVFLIVVLLLGPGLAVHGVLKEHWGRARPRQVERFGGEKHFTPAWVMSDQIAHNSSFVSGHAAMGFYPLCVYFLNRRKRWLLIGLALGGLVGMGRILQGGHFLSDVVFSGFVVWLCAWISAHFLLPRPAIYQPA